MKKKILSSAVIVLFGIYTFLVRTGDISGQLFKSHPIPVELTDTKVSSPISVANPTSNTAKVARNVDCVYVSSDQNDEENYGDDEEGEKGYYKCTTIIVPAPETTTTIANGNTTTPVPKTKPPTPVVTPPPVIKPKIVGIYKDGTFIGDAVDAYYGNVQVSATFSNGHLSDIVFLDYPQDRRTSLQKSNQAMPILKKEAISSQSANVNTVSGVTYTSEAFMQSLSSALTQAKI